MAIDLKGRPLSEALSAALIPYRLRAVDGTLVSDDDDACQAIIDAHTVEDAQAAVIAAIDAHAKALRDQVVAPYSAAEMASWPIKLQEARGQKGSEILAAEATARGITQAALIQKVEQKAAAFMAMEGAISGVAGKHLDAVRALSTFAEIAAYNWREGWPL